MFNTFFLLIIIQSFIAFLLIAIFSVFYEKGLSYFLKKIIAISLAIPLSTAILYILLKDDINNFCNWISKDINNITYFIVGTFCFIVLWCFAYLFSKLIIKIINKLTGKIKRGRKTH